MAQPIGFLPTLPSLLSQPGRPFIHRDMSWLQFNERVLAEARSSSNNPLLERLKFIAISASNLDEFFMIRLSSLGRSIQQAAKSDPATGSRLSLIRANILESVAEFAGRQAETLDLASYDLESKGVEIRRVFEAEDPRSLIASEIFEREIRPLLPKPQNFTVGKLSQLENLQTAVILGGREWIPIPKTLPTVFTHHAASEGKFYAFFLDDLIRAFYGAGQVAGFIRLTRDGDISSIFEEQEVAEFPGILRDQLKTREKGRPVRLQYWGEIAESLLAKALQSLRLGQGQVIFSPTTLFLQGLWQVFYHCPKELGGRPEMTYSGFQSAIPKPLLDRKRIFDRIKSEDMLLHHPYDSFDAFLEWLDLSARDPQVQSIEITIYRMGVNSPIAEALKTAASLGKKVRVLIELRARFDELNNLKLSEEFRSHGIEVGHGFSKLKLHAKLALVTRQEGERLVHYTHLSTGNYHAQTAKQYTDFGILTANAEIGEDAALFFRKCLKGEMPSSFKKLLNAPSRLHKKLLQHIEEEMNFSRSGGKGRIVVKVNAMVDEEVTEKLYEASQAGVSVDLIVRGACSVVPGVQGLSENIRVFSIVDRFLEHSRIYYFGSTRTLYLSSADWMPRNFFSRLELAFPVLDPDIYRYIEEFVLPIYLSDYAKAWELTPLGVWKRRPPSSTRPFLTAGLQSLLRGKRSRIDQRSQILFEEIVKRDYQGTPLA